MELNNKAENTLGEVTDKEDSTYSIILTYEKKIKQKDKLIVELQNMLEKEKIKVQSYEGKIKNVNKQYNRFQQYKELLNKKINSLQENLIAKEEMMNELEKKYLEKENRIAFPQDWIADVIVAQVSNVSPCEFDIVGFNGAPAAYYNITEDFVCFRMRLNGCPNIQNKDRQKNAVWGVQIRNITNEILFIARVKVAGNSQKVQIVAPNDDKVIYEEDVNLHNGIIKSEIKRDIHGTTRIYIDGSTEKTNVQVSTSDITDESVNSECNYFLDFKLPRNQFIVDESEFDFEDETFKLYYFTSISYDGKLNVININEEQPLCGKIINPTD